MLVWFAIIVAFACIAYLYDQVRIFEKSMNELNKIVMHREALRQEAFQEFSEKIEIKLNNLRANIGFEEYKNWLDQNAILEERYRRLGSIFPRLDELESELDCLQRHVRETHLINGLRDPVEFPADDRKRVLAQMRSENEKDNRCQERNRLNGLRRASS